MHQHDLRVAALAEEGRDVVPAIRRQGHDLERVGVVTGWHGRILADRICQRLS